MAVNFSLAPNNGISLVGTGLILWLAGVIFITFLPVLAPVGVVLAFVGQVIFWIGIVLFLILLVRSFFAG